jgi:predicted ATPase
MTDAADGSRQASGSLVAAAMVEQGRPFVGRVQELRELRAALEAAAARQGCLLLVTGEPGIGKSRLMEELSGQLAGQGWRVLVGRCWEHGGAPAYWPWMQVVRAAGSELVEWFPGMPTAADPETARFLLFDAVGRFLRRVAEPGPVLVVLDDLHAADEPSLVLLRFLAQTVTDAQVVIVGAYRDAEPRVHELAEVFGDLVRVGRRVPLRGLSRAEVAAYLLRLAGRAPPGAVVARIHDVTAGNPLFVGEVVQALLAGGDLGTGEGQVTDPCCGSPRSCAASSVAG